MLAQEKVFFIFLPSIISNLKEYSCEKCKKCTKAATDPLFSRWKHRKIFEELIETYILTYPNCQRTIYYEPLL